MTGLSGPAPDTMSNPDAQCSRCQRPLPAGSSSRLCGGCFLAATLGDGPGQDPAPVGTLGDYDILREIARGGMGVIYEARDRRLNRRVALKTIVPIHASDPAFLERFRAEAEAVARLDHPHVVPIYEVGEEDGRMFFVMRLMEGGSLAGLIAASRSRATPAAPASLPAPDIAGWMSVVARAVQHAHDRGILHRDLKPANILLDSDGQPYVTDFGLAKQMAASLGLTATGAQLGTAPYMSPEQVRGGGDPITASTDVYSLGAILYELLTGRPPFAEATHLATMRAVTDTEPPRPRDLVPQVNRDLETICLHCLEKDPDRRYASAAELADDLDRWRRHEPIHARPGTAWARAKKWMRRHPTITAASLLILAAVAVSTTIWWNGRREIDAGRAAMAASGYFESIQQASDAVRDQRFAQANAELGRWLPRSGETDLRGFEWFLLREQARGNATRILTTNAGAKVITTFSPDGRIVLALNGRNSLQIWDPVSGRLLRELPCPQGTNPGIAMSAKDRSIIAHFDGGVFRRWNADGSPQTTELPKGWEFGLGSVVWSSDGSQLALRRNDNSNWTTHPLVVLESSGATTAIHRVSNPLWYAFYTNHSLAVIEHLPATTNRDQWRSYLRFLQDPEQAPRSRQVLPDDFDKILALSPDGRHLLYKPASRAGASLIITSQATNSTPLRGLAMTADSATFSPDGRLVALAGRDGYISLWTVPSLDEVGRLTGMGGPVTSLAFAPDGRALVAGSGDGSIRWWQGPVVPRSDRPVAITTTGTVDVMFTVADEPAVVTAYADEPAQCIRLTDGHVETVPTDGARTPIAATRTNVVMVNNAVTNGIRLDNWDRQTRQFTATRVLTPQGANWRCLVDLPTRAVVITSNGWSRSINALDGSVRWSITNRPGWAPRAIAEAPDQKSLYFHRIGGSPRWISLPGGRILTHVTNPVPPGTFLLQDPAYAPDSSAIVGRETNSVLVFALTDPATPVSPTAHFRHAGDVTAFAFSPAPHRLAVALDDGTVSIRTWPAGRELLKLPVADGKAVALFRLEFTADGQWLVGGDGAHTVYRWHAPRP